MVAPPKEVSMRSLMICFLALAAACGDDGGSKPIDAKMIDAPPTVDLTCTNYCTKITANCTGANQQFDMMAQCMSSCAHLPMGTAADMSGNTLGCHIYHATAAMANPGVHCVHAGPGGAGMCGANC